VYLHFDSLATDDFAAGDEAIEHESHLAARIDNNVVAFPRHLINRKRAFL
jgi:hypothetical protein